MDGKVEVVQEKAGKNVKRVSGSPINGDGVEIEGEILG